MAPANKKQLAKGQMVFEFAVAALLFFSIMFFIITYLNQNVRSFSSDAYLEILQSKAFQISDMLLRNPGIWVNQEPRVIGLEKDWPVLDGEKIIWFSNYCDSSGGYDSLKGLLGLKEIMYDFDTGENRNFNVTITDIESSAVLANCGKEVGGTKGALIRRVAVSEGLHLLTIDVNVW
jgi:hypothetical protein